VSGTEIIKHRKNLSVNSISYIADSYKIIMEGGKSHLYIIISLKISSTEDITERFNELLADKREEEIRRAQNLTGPHKDDFVFNINGFNLKTLWFSGTA
jgi:recombinational DNA repair ATPase RecF